MNQFVDSLFRLYRDNKVSDKTLNELLVSKKINKQEYEYIISAKKVV